jgi:pimeloyl-ACP methyl ester carboxylesterase
MDSDWNDLGAVVDHLRALRGVEKVSLVGWSQGGTRTAGYVARHPQKVARLVVLAPAYQRKMPSAASKDVKGKPVTNGRLFPGTTWKGTHVTDGLDWNGGAKTARDIMAAAGTLVLAPESGRIIRHGSAQGGQALYFMADSGHLYWMGHIDDMAPVGARVKKGQGIARISADHAAPHLHIDRYYGKNPGRYS